MLFFLLVFVVDIICTSKPTNRLDVTVHSKVDKKEKKWNANGSMYANTTRTTWPVQLFHTNWIDFYWREPALIITQKNGGR
jgi:hypothetical protein